MTENILTRLLELNHQNQITLNAIQKELKNIHPWMNKKQAAEYIGMSKGNFDRYMDKIPHSKATGRPKWHRKDLDAFMESQKTEVY